LGIGDWGLGIGDWGLGIGPNPQSPNSMVISYTFFLKIKNVKFYFNYINNKIK
jgi:hypothetical protein